MGINMSHNPYSPLRQPVMDVLSRTLAALVPNNSESEIILTPQSFAALKKRYMAFEREHPQMKFRARRGFGFWSIRRTA